VTPSDPSLPDEDEEALEHSLEQGLRRAPLTDAAYARIHAAVADEWRASHPPKSRWAARQWAAMAAGLAAIIVIAVVVLRSTGKPDTLGVIARIEGDGLILRHTFLPDRKLAVGTTLHSREVFTAGGSVLIELKEGGTLRVARGTRLEVTGGGAVAVEEGEAYADLPPGSTRASTFVVRTPFGLVEHLGTQFDVSVNNDLRIRVREGRVRLRRDSDTETVAAGTELLVPRNGPTTQRAIATHGPEWSWVEALEPDYVIENRALIEFLQWAARETGRRLSFMDEHAHEVAEETRLHGSISGLSPGKALETVLTTTSLRYEFEDGVVKVSSGG